MRFMEFYSVFIAINLYFPPHQPIPLLINIECCIRCRTLNRYYRLYFEIAIRFRPLMSSDGDPIHFSPWIWIRIPIRYKIKGNAEFNQQKSLLNFSQLFLLMRANLYGLGSDFIIFFFTFKSHLEINLVIKLTWIRIHITGLVIGVGPCML